MTKTQNGNFSAKRRTFYAVIAALMGIVIAAGVLYAISMIDTLGKENSSIL